MKKTDFDKHKFDTKWRVAVLAILLVFAGFLQLFQAPMANEFVALIIGLVGGGASIRHVG